MASPDLVGVDLGEGWTVTSAVSPSPSGTGGNFSLGYLAHHASGREGFVKVINYEAVLFSVDPTAELQRITEAYNFERDLVDRCTRKNLSRVVTAYKHGNMRVAHYSYPVSFIIFERADNDIRTVLDASVDLELAVKLRMIHHAAAGIAQLHSIGVAHQDVKPSNLLVFNSTMRAVDSAKIGDLGRATDQAYAARHDSYPIAGDPSYAPPEQCFGETPSSFGARRLACDIYQLGSLLAYLVTGGMTMNTLLHHFLDPRYAPRNWSGTYAEVLPYVQAAHAASLAAINSSFSHPLAAALIDLIECTTNPEVERRGHRASHKARQPYAMNRIVAELDLLARRAESHYLQGRN